MNKEHPEDKMRKAQEIARRALIVSSLTAVAYGDPRHDVNQWLQTEGLLADLSPSELRFLKDTSHDEKIRISFTWGVERLVPLLWSIQKIPELAPLTRQCDTEALQRAVVWPPADTSDFVRSAEIRPIAQIDDEYERVYEAHWLVRDAQLHGRAIPDGIIAEVIYERHYAFNWIIGYCGQSWDEISTDT